ncbi:MAG: L,D-transpeptidase family protein [Gammaproteobacteria bacterium]|nr:L,D-transpeptidase family protein [Gammaproteobacteria bacterium]
MFTRRKVFVAGTALATILFSGGSVRGSALSLRNQRRGGYTVSERLTQYGPIVESRLRRAFESAGLSYPPHELAYIAFKDSRRFEVYGRMSPVQRWRFVKAYPIRAASGKLGPKLAEGDNQVPEGSYRAAYLNPNSQFHLSIRVNYPNEYDRHVAKADGRTRLGGDIMIHGNAVSIGCLAVGDQAAEDLFVLAALASPERVRVIISPTDFRLASASVPVAGPPWIGDLYVAIRAELQQFQRKP